MTAPNGTTLLDVQRNGSLLVTEILTYDLGSVAWRGLYQDIILANNEKVEGVQVYRHGSGGRERLAPGSGIKLGVGGVLLAPRALLGSLPEGTGRSDGAALLRA